MKIFLLSTLPLLIVALAATAQEEPEKLSPREAARLHRRAILDKGLDPERRARLNKNNHDLNERLKQILEEYPIEEDPIDEKPVIAPIPVVPAVPSANVADDNDAEEIQERAEVKTASNVAGEASVPNFDEGVRDPIGMVTQLMRRVARLEAQVHRLEKKLEAAERLRDAFNTEY